MSSNLTVVIDHVGKIPRTITFSSSGPTAVDALFPAELQGKPPAGTTRTWASLPPNRVVIESALSIVLTPKQDGGNHARR